MDASRRRRRPTTTSAGRKRRRSASAKKPGPGGRRSDDGAQAREKGREAPGRSLVRRRRRRVRGLGRRRRGRSAAEPSPTPTPRGATSFSGFSCAEDGDAEDPFGSDGGDAEDNGSPTGSSTSRQSARARERPRGRRADRAGASVKLLTYLEPSFTPLSLRMPTTHAPKSPAAAADAAPRRHHRLRTAGLPVHRFSTKPAPQNCLRTAYRSGALRWSTTRTRAEGSSTAEPRARDFLHLHRVYVMYGTCSDGLQSTLMQSGATRQCSSEHATMTGLL